MLRNRLFLVLLAAAMLLSESASAHLYNFTLFDGVNDPRAATQPQALDFTIYIDPLHTNWLAWSRFSTSRELHDQPMIGGPVADKGTAEQELGEFTVQLTDPKGVQSDPLPINRSDAAGNAYGQQSVLFGDRKLAPWVVRNGALMSEPGGFNDFIRNGGDGYYKFHLTFGSKLGAAQPDQHVYMLMDVYDGFRFPETSGGGADSGFPSTEPDVNGGNNNGSNNGGNSNNPNPNPNPTPEPTPIETETPVPTDTPSGTPTPNPNGSQGIMAFDTFPSAPNYPDQPVVPEPATLTLSGLGFGTAWLLKRRK